jgi:CheY-like chemotaxis protein
MSRILVVEDDDASRYAVARALEAAGDEVVQARSYQEALPILEDGSGQLDLLLIDLVLPGVNGFALARMGRMRRHDLKVIYMTGYDDVPVHEASGPILRKPVTPDALITAVHGALSAVA